MMQFQYPGYLWFLFIIPLIIFSYIIYLFQRRSIHKKIAESHLLPQQVFGIIKGRGTTRMILLLGSLLFSILGVANLRKGAGAETRERSGVDVIFALDVSNSMLATDVSPDRLTRSKQLIERMVNTLQNHRVGLIIFAGSAYLQTPLTTDYGAFKMMLQSASPKMVPDQGTVLADAIDLARASFSEKEHKYKSLVIISDGEDHDNAAISAAKKAESTGVIIHTIGVGSPGGGEIKNPNTGELMKDVEGNVVVTKLNENNLIEMAQAGNGSYQNLQNVNAVANNLKREVNSMESKNMGSIVFTQYSNYFIYFFIVAFVLLVSYFLIPENSKKAFA